MTWIRPDEALRPNRVPCGPRNTSTRSTGPSSVRPVPMRLRYTPSINIATELSRPGLSPTVPMPRMRAPPAPASDEVEDTSSDGLTWLRPRRSTAPEFLIVSAVIADTASGTSLSASLRRVAVTMMASESTASAARAALSTDAASTGASDGVAGGAVVVWAKAGVERTVSPAESSQIDLRILSSQIPVATFASHVTVRGES